MCTKRQRESRNKQFEHIKQLTQTIQSNQFSIVKNVAIHLQLSVKHEHYISTIFHSNDTHTNMNAIDAKNISS